MRLALVTNSVPESAIVMLSPPAPPHERRRWDEFEGDNAGPIAIAFEYPDLANILTADAIHLLPRVIGPKLRRRMSSHGDPLGTATHLDTSLDQNPPGPTWTD